MVDVQIIVMAAISVDRFTSLAQPLRYNNLITHRSMERYILLFWVYAGLVGLSPLLYAQCLARHTVASCSFLAVIDKPVRFFLCCAVYGPCALILMGQSVGLQNIHHKPLGDSSFIYLLLSTTTSFYKGLTNYT